ncbi:MAG: ankyrin repeat domain-containing protein [Candidatus Methylacidiphilales bacterium]|nr:ankyrin repeat domain-containing protein [Candidatus Methylacidiphilales bacterium]
MKKYHHDRELIDAVYEGNREALTEMEETGSVLFDELLHIAAGSGYAVMVRFLINRLGKQALNSFDDQGFTPLMHAARNGHLPVMGILLEAGADVNAYDTSVIGNTALREVIPEGSSLVVKALLDAGADPLIPGWMGRTAYDKAKELAEKLTATEKARQIFAIVREAACRLHPGLR